MRKYKTITATNAEELDAQLNEWMEREDAHEWHILHIGMNAVPLGQTNVGAVLFVLLEYKRRTQ